MISELPITMKDVEKLEDLLGSCDRMYNGTRPRVTNRDYELLYDSNLVSKSHAHFMMTTSTNHTHLAPGDPGLH